MDDPTEWFVDRARQVTGFQRMLRGETTKCIMAIRAPAGMGKTWLIQRFRRECSANNLPTLYIDFRDRRPYDYLTIVRTARDQMGTVAFNLLTQTINDTTGINIRPSGMPEAGTHISIAGDVAGGSIIKDHYFYVQADSPAVRSAAEIRITEAFFTCLSALATPEKKCVFLFDSYEEVTEEANRWLHNNLLSRLRDGQLPNAVAILAGRTTPEFGEEWRASLAWTGLDPLSQDDVRDYIVNKRQVIGLDVATVFLTSGGRPGLLSQMVELAALGTQKDEDWL